MLSCAPIQGHVGGLVDVSDSYNQNSICRIVLTILLDPERMHDLGPADGYL